MGTDNEKVIEILEENKRLDKENKRLRHQRKGLQETVFERGDTIVSQAEIIKGLQDEVLELIKNTEGE